MAIEIVSFPIHSMVDLPYLCKRLPEGTLNIIPTFPDAPWCWNIYQHKKEERHIAPMIHSFVQ